MTRGNLVSAVSLVLVLLLLAVAPVHADVNVYGDSPPVTTLINGTITDDSDPISEPWQPVGPSMPGTLAGGGGPPDVAFRSVTQWPVVVWAAEGAINHDIVFSEWNGFSWTVPLNLTMGPADERDPRIFVEDDGTLHVVWWKLVAPSEVHLVTRPAGSNNWTTPVKVNLSSESARRPSVAVFDDKLWVAYERDSTQPGMVQDLVTARLQPNGSFARHVLMSTARADELDPVLHARGDKFWTDWKNSATEFGSVEFVGSGWSAPSYEPWTDPTWVGVEAVRKTIMQEVVDP